VKKVEAKRRGGKAREAKATDKKKVAKGCLTDFSDGSAASVLRYKHGFAASRHLYRRGSAESTHRKTTYARIVVSSPQRRSTQLFEPSTFPVCVPLTTQIRGGDYEVKLPRVRWLPGADEGVANVQGLTSVENHRLERRAGQFEARVTLGVRDKIAWRLEL